MTDFLETFKAEGRKFTFEELLPGAFEVQELLQSEDIESLIGGGVGIDLLALKYLKDTPSRPHKDVDLYIPIIKRAKTLKTLEKYGAQVETFSYTNAVHGKFKLRGVMYDLFSIDGGQDNAFVQDPSYIKIIAERQLGSASLGHDDNKKVNRKPDVVKWNGKTFSVMDIASQLSMAEGLSIVSKRDVKILEELSQIHPQG